MTRMAGGVLPLVLLAFVTTSACLGRSPDPAADYEAARHALREGRSTAAATLAHDAAAGMTDATSPWHERLQLLEAEAHLFALEADKAAALLASLPDTPARPQEALRREYLGAYVQVLTGATAAALPRLAQTAAQARAAGFTEIALDATVLRTQLLLRQGQFAVADDLLLDALDSADDTLAFERGALRLNLGMSRLVRSRFDEALGYFERVLDDTRLEHTLVYRIALGNAGICYSRLGELDRAIAVQQRAVAGHERAGLDQYLQQSLGALGVTLVLSGRTTEGLADLDKARDIAAREGYTADAATWASNLALAYGDLGDWARSERFNEASLHFKEQVHAQNIGYNVFTRARIAAGRGRTDEALAGFEAALAAAGDDPNLAWMAHAGLAQTYRTLDRMPDAVAHFEAGLARIERTRADLLTPEYRLTFLARLIRFHQNYVDALVTSGDTARALEVAESSRARVLMERHRLPDRGRVSAAEMVDMARRTGSVLLSYWLAPARSFVWVITGDGIRLVTLPSRTVIDRLVHRYREFVTVSLADPMAVERSAGDDLADAVLGPVLDIIPPGASVVVVPDGGLHDITFDMLPIRTPRPHYWLEDVTVTMAPSLALAAVATPTRHAQSSLLLVGDPAPGDPSQPALPYAAAEVSAIADAFHGPETVLRGAKATPDAVLAGDPSRFSLIHFAAHAIASADSPLDSAILLAPARQATARAALAPGAADTPVADAHSKLYARDVAAHHLSADVVTLSACRSAGGRAYDGEGLVGFAWAFLRAGARQVVAGLWDVDDQSTSLLMERYYTRLGEGATAATALRDAKLSLLNDDGNFHKPYYWAAFAVFSASMDAR